MSIISLNFKDAATGNSLYKVDNPLYNIDSLTITALNGDSVSIYKTTMQKNSVPYYWYAFFYPIKDIATLDGSLGTQVCKEYVIHYSHAERDTIKVCFTSKYTNCTSILETAKVYNSTGLLTSEKNTTEVNVDLIKH